MYVTERIATIQQRLNLSGVLSNNIKTHTGTR